MRIASKECCFVRLKGGSRVQLTLRDAKRIINLLKRVKIDVDVSENPLVEKLVKKFLILFRASKRRDMCFIRDRYAMRGRSRVFPESTHSRT